MDDEVPRRDRSDAGMLLVEMCKADSNKLVPICRKVSKTLSWPRSWADFSLL